MMLNIMTWRETPCMPSLRLLLLILLLCLMHIEPAYGIQCYECVHNNQRVRRHDRFVYPCSEFDGSPRYIMDCPDSPFCVYQRITLNLATEQVNVVTMDGCTPNTTERGRIIEASLVRPGCLRHRNAYRPPASEYCYCDYNFCNLAPTTYTPSLITLLAPLSLWLYAILGLS